MTATPTLSRAEVELPAPPPDPVARGTADRPARSRHGLLRRLRTVRLGGGDLEPVRQFVLLAPADRRVHPRPRHPAPRHLLVHCSGNVVGRAVVARRSHLRRPVPVVRRVRRSFLRRRRRRRYRPPRIPPGVAVGAGPRGGLWHHARGARGDLHALVGAAAVDRRALPPGAALGRRGAGQLRGPAPDRRAARALLAVGERARQLRARIRVPGAAPARTLGRRPSAVGRA